MNDYQALSAPFAHLLDHVMAGETQPFLDIFAGGNISVNVPHYGFIGNNVVFGRYLNNVKSWISERHGVRYEFWGEVHNSERMAVNMVLYFSVDDEEFNFHQELHIPISALLELENGKVRNARVYYSTMWVAGHNMVRPAIINEDPEIIPNLPRLERLYFECLHSGGGDTIMRDVIDPNAYFMGTAYSLTSGPELVKTFEHLSSGGNNTQLRICSAFHSDEGHLVIEYMNFSSGGTPNTPSAGLAIYAINPDDGKFAFVRLAGDSLFDHCLWPTL